MTAIHTALWAGRCSCKCSMVLTFHNTCEVNFKNKGSLMISISHLSDASVPWLECLNTTNIPHLFTYRYRYRKFILRRICETWHNISPVGLLLRQTMADSIKSQISIQKYTAEISQMSMHILYNLSYIKRSRLSMSIKKNEKSEAAELKVCVSKLLDWLQSETLMCLKKKMMFFINFYLWWN